MGRPTSWVEIPDVLGEEGGGVASIPFEFEPLTYLGVMGRPTSWVEIPDVFGEEGGVASVPFEFEPITYLGVMGRPTSWVEIPNVGPAIGGPPVDEVLPPARKRRRRLPMYPTRGGLAGA